MPKVPKKAHTLKVSERHITNGQSHQKYVLGTAPAALNLNVGGCHPGFIRSTFALPLSGPSNGQMIAKRYATCMCEEGVGERPCFLMTLIVVVESLSLTV